MVSMNSFRLKSSYSSSLVRYLHFISANKNVFGNMLRELKLSSLITKISWDTLEALNISNTNIQPGQLYHLIVRSHVTNFN